MITISLVDVVFFLFVVILIFLGFVGIGIGLRMAITDKNKKSKPLIRDVCKLCDEADFCRKNTLDITCYNNYKIKPQNRRHCNAYIPYGNKEYQAYMYITRHKEGTKMSEMAEEHSLFQNACLSPWGHIEKESIKNKGDI